MRITRTARLFAIAATILSVPAGLGADDNVEYFEREIRPVLAGNCYSCHSAAAPNAFANLYLDRRASVFGEAGRPAVVNPGDSGGSPLIKALRGEPMQMPPTGKLPDPLIAKIAAWIDDGASWPDEAAAPAPSSRFHLTERRDAHWAWQPVRDTPPPAVEDRAWPLHSTDAFLLAKLEQEGLRPAEAADRRTLLRRVTEDLTGLPPTPEEIEAFVADQSPDAYEQTVGRLLASPHFGERWARHWMDLMRYTESHGSEGDPAILDAWRYRDYLIRALNADVPYDQLIREHIAGDLLDKPRIDLAGHRNESLIGTANLRMVEHSFQPVQPWEDRVKWTDNQIDVLSKSFLGLTVSCARCHDHKFDAISQADYYALFGSIKGARPIQAAIDDSAYLRTNRRQLVELRGKIRQKLAESWRAALPELAEQIRNDAPLAELEAAYCDRTHPLSLWAEARQTSGDRQQQRFETAISNARGRLEAERAHNKNFQPAWKLPRDAGEWFFHGTGLIDPVSPAGAFAVAPHGERALSGIYPAGSYSHLVSSKHDAIAQSPRFKVDSEYISIQLLGGDVSNVRLMIENYPVPRGGIYHQRHAPERDTPYWVTWKTTYWKGFTAYIEFAQYGDLTNHFASNTDSESDPREKPNPEGRSSFGALAIVFHDGETPPVIEDRAIEHFLRNHAADGKPAFAAETARILGEAIDAWANGEIDDGGAAYLDAFVRPGLLPVTLDALPDVRPLVERYRELEAEVPVARRAPSVLEESPPPQELLIRGDHNRPGDPVPRRFLTALGGEPCSKPRLARLHLAEQIAAPGNPLTARVAVNRVWQKLFGRGLVSTVDNFGKLGDAPSHPALLDHLAARFVRSGWSLKSLIRELTTSRAYRMSSAASAEAQTKDPANRWLQHMPVRRLEAEAIRDTLLSVSGELNPKLYGPSIPVYFAFSPEQDKGSKPPGPRDGELRRSIYQEIRRNAHNPFLETFDVPPPASTRGERDQTNVPGQSLTLLNSLFVRARAEAWSRALVQRPDPTAADRVSHMYETLFARPPTEEETRRALSFLDAMASQGEILREPAPWADLAHGLFNLKEFLYLR